MIGKTSEKKFALRIKVSKCRLVGDKDWCGCGLRAIGLTLASSLVTVC